VPSLKITLVGGGSLNWTPRLVASILQYESLSGSQVMLYDLNPEPLEVTYALCNRYRERTGSSTTIEKTTDRAVALDGAHGVVVTISTGGLEAMRRDIEVAEQYSICHTVGDTCGPAGISRLLRNVPIFVDLARAMEVHCPHAWMLNCSNPLSGLTRVVNRETSIRALGVCHGVSGTASAYQSFASAERIAYMNSGIDHCSWFTAFQTDDVDFRRSLVEQGIERWLELPPPDARDDPTFNALFSHRNGIRLGLQIGVLPAIGDRHLCEFLPTFMNGLENIEKFGLIRTPVADRQQGAKDAWERIRKTIEADDLEVPRPTIDDVAAWVSALHGGPQIEDNVSAPNEGQIPQLPHDCVVETRAVLDSAGCHPLVSPMPAAIEAIVAPHAIRDELVVEAALEGSRDKALAALSSDPTVGGQDIAAKLLDDLIKASASLLPQFHTAGTRSS
jgi:alpha-galactosidase